MQIKIDRTPPRPKHATDKFVAGHLYKWVGHADNANSESNSLFRLCVKDTNGHKQLIDPANGMHCSTAECNLGEHYAPIAGAYLQIPSSPK